jgi:hypothetical protein
VTYAGFLLFSLCFLDALTPLDTRILSPLFVFGIPFVVSLIWRGRPPLWQSIMSAAAIVACSRGGAAFTLARQRHDLGYGYTGRAWRASPTLAWIDALAGDVRIYSNSPELIAFHNRRRARPLPIRFSPTSLQPNAELDRDVASLRTDLQRGATVIYFTRNPSAYLLSDTDLEWRYHIPALLRMPDGAIYGYRVEDLNAMITNK